MRKLGLVIAAAVALAFSALPTAPARADGGAVAAGVIVGSWAWCHLTSGRERVTPLCWWHDSWHDRWDDGPKKKAKKKSKKKK